MLTPEQVAERREGIGASDARRIIDGDWWSLWMEKTGRAPGEDLSSVWAVQLGSHTESLNLDWYERNTGRKVTRRGEAVVSADYPFLRANLDGVDETAAVIIEAKHVNGFSRPDDVLARYTPQVIHQMLVTGIPDGVLSVIIGANEPVLLKVEYDEFWAMQYVDKAREFWGYVERGEAPSEGRPAVLAPPPPPKQMRTVDMTGSNAWGDAAGRWLENRSAAKTFEAAVKDIKALVEFDVGTATGHGIKVSRSKAGALTIKES